MHNGPAAQIRKFHFYVALSSFCCTILQSLIQVRHLAGASKCFIWVGSCDVSMYSMYVIGVLILHYLFSYTWGCIILSCTGIVNML